MKNQIINNSMRNIKKAFPRFISLTIMSMLGVFAFTGLQATAPDMMDTLSSYLKEHNTYDVKIISTLGLTDDDITTIKKIKGIEDAEGSCSKDTLITIHNTEYVINVSSLPKSINSLSVIEGRLPEKKNEIVVESLMMDGCKLEIGDSILLDDDSFKQKEATIVGVIDSSLYYNFAGTVGGRGSTSIGSGTINYYTYMLESNFNQDYYSSIYCTVKNADSFTTASEDYTNAVDKVMDSLEEIKETCQKNRYESIKQDTTNEIENQKEDAYAKLDEANQKLIDAKSTLDEAQNTLSSSYSTLESSKVKLSNAKEQLDSGKVQLDEAKSALDSFKIQLDAGKEQLNIVKNSLDLSLQQLESSKSTLDASKVELDNKQNELNENKNNLETNTGLSVDEIKNNYATLNETIIQLKSVKDQFIQLENDKAQLIEVNEKLSGELSDDEREQLLNEKVQLENEISTLEAVLSGLDISTIQAQLDTYLVQKDSLQTAYDSAIQIEIGQNTINEKKVEWENKYIEYQNGLNTYNVSYVSYEGKYNEYYTQLNMYNTSYASYLEKLNTYNTSYASYLSGLVSYQSGEQEYEKGLKEYQDGLTSYEKSKKEYEDSKKEVDQKIEDAYDELNDLETPKWYIYDRTNYTTYNEYIDDTNSISNLAGIFPVVFYAVAILVSLISMNRMVEDDRVEIGTLKSLGFSNRDILFKYLLFSLCATILGGITGAITGITYLPYMINNIYTILFSLPDLHYLPNFTTTILGVLISIICVCGTTIYTVQKVLKEKPSELMRPKAPKAGKRIILEHFSIWKKMNFSQKVIARNIFRYKKRVVVTIIGVAGCTALMLCGFGIKDSIVDIPTSQYGSIFTFDGYAYVNESDDQLDSIFDDKNIESISKTEIVSTTVDNTKINLFVCEDGQSLSKIVNLEDRDTKEMDSLETGKVVITEKFAELKNLKVGDTVEFLDLNNHSYPLVISDIVDNYVDHYAFIDKETYESFGQKFECNVVYFHTAENYNQDELTEHLLSYDEIVNVSYIESLIEKVGNMLTSLDKVVYILILLSALLSFVVLYNLSNININERKREIATLKVLGFLDKEVDNYITKENVLLTIIGILLGLIFGFFLTRIVVSTVEIERCRFIYQIKPMSYAYSVVLAFSFTLIVNFVAHFILKRIDMIESLKSVE